MIYGPLIKVGIIFAILAAVFGFGYSKGLVYERAKNEHVMLEMYKKQAELNALVKSKNIENENLVAKLEKTLYDNDSQIKKMADANRRLLASNDKRVYTRICADNSGPPETGNSVDTIDTKNSAAGVQPEFAEFLRTETERADRLNDQLNALRDWAKAACETNKEILECK